VSSSPIAMRQKITPFQFWGAVIGLALAAIAAFVVLASVAGKHGTCPSETQVSRPAASSCFEAYQQQSSTGAIG
jgi:hypothetical protein